MNKLLINLSSFPIDMNRLLIDMNKLFINLIIKQILKIIYYLFSLWENRTHQSENKRF